MIYRPKSFDLEITDGEYHHDQTFSPEIIPSQTLSLKQVKIIKLSDNHSCDISLESSQLRDHRF